MKIRGTRGYTKDVYRHLFQHNDLDIRYYKHWLDYQEDLGSWKSRHRKSLPKFKGSKKIKAWELLLESYALSDELSRHDRKLIRAAYDAWG